MTLPAPAPKSTHVPALVHLVAAVLAVAVTLIALFGFPLLIVLADGAALLAIALMVGLTALDLKASAKPRRAAEPARAGAAAQAA